MPSQWGGSVNVSEPTAGFYKMRMLRGAPFSGVRVWFGAPLDPATGDELDRSPCWNAQCNGTWIDIDRVWPSCMNESCSEAEYRYLAATHEHALATDAYHPMATPRKRVDWSTATPPTF